MFPRNDSNSHCIDENDTNSFSFPYYERFSTVNVPKSRLGKRRTIDSSSCVKRDVFKELSIDSNSRNPLIGNEDQNKFARSTGTSSESPVSDVNDVRKVLNKSFEVSEGSNGDQNDFKSLKSGELNIERTGDSSHSEHWDCSFKTAVDIYTADKSRLHQESLYFKTPRKGFSLMDVLSSPVDPLVSRPWNSDNESLGNVLSKTPCLNKLDTYKTPFKSHPRMDLFANELFTPTLINNPKTPMIRNNHLTFNSPLPLVESEQETANNRVTAEARRIDYDASTKTTPPSDESNGFSEFSKPSPSLVKRKILEGLGWSVSSSASFPLQTPGSTPCLEQHKDGSSDRESCTALLTPNDSSTDSSQGSSSLACSSKMDVSKMDVYCTLTQTIAHDPCQNSSDHSIESSVECHRSGNLSQCVTISETSHLNETINDTNSSIAPVGISNTIEVSSLDKTCIEERNIINSGSSFDSSNISVGKLNLDSTHKDDNDKPTNFNIDVKTNNEIDNSNLTNTNLNSDEQSEPETKITASLDSSQEANATAILVQPQERNQPVSKASNAVDLEAMPPPANPTSDKSVFLPPQPVLTFQPQVIKPQSNVVYVNKKPYTVLSMLGRGGSSEVYQVLDAETSKLMAVKFVNLASVEENIAAGYLNEIEVLSKLQGCPSVIKMFDSEYVPSSKILYVVMEKGDTDFSRLMKDIMKTKKISMSMITYYWTEMLSCVKDIHEKGIIHSDLKPANFLLVSGRLKLIDFGIASSLQGDMTSVLKECTTGTFNYMSPEAIRYTGETRGYKITYKSDIWSLGCILYNLLYGRTPFSHLSTWAKLQAIANPNAEVSFPSHVSAPPNLLYSVRCALRKDPKERPTASDLLQLAESTPSTETQLGRQISNLLAEYISQIFPSCVKLETDIRKDKKF